MMPRIHTHEIHKMTDRGLHVSESSKLAWDTIQGTHVILIRFASDNLESVSVAHITFNRTLVLDPRETDRALGVSKGAVCGDAYRNVRSCGPVRGQC